MVCGLEVLDEDFSKWHIKIVFNLIADNPTKRFVVQDDSHLKDKKWILDISELFKADYKQVM